MVRDRVLAELPNERVLRITGKVKVIDAGTLSFEDGTQVTVASTIDAPALDQKALLDGKFYPAGRDAAEFLRKLIGDKPVRFFAWDEKEDKEPVRGLCFVGETQLGMEMVRNGWAVAHYVLARASEFGATSIAYDGRTWSAGKDEEWAETPEVTADRIVVTLA